MSSGELLELANEIEVNSEIFNSQGDTFQHAMTNRNFNSKSDISKPLKKVKRELVKNYPHLNIEAIAIQTMGGAFDLKPYYLISR